MRTRPCCIIIEMDKAVSQGYIPWVHLENIDSKKASSTQAHVGGLRVAKTHITGQSEGTKIRRVACRIWEQGGIHGDWHGHKVFRFGVMRMS